MTSVELALAKLDAAREGVTPGPWRDWCGDTVQASEAEVADHLWREQDARHIATFDPTVTAALCDVARQAQIIVKCYRGPEVDMLRDDLAVLADAVNGRQGERHE